MGHYSQSQPVNVSYCIFSNFVCAIIIEIVSKCLRISVSLSYVDDFCNMFLYIYFFCKHILLIYVLMVVFINFQFMCTSLFMYIYSLCSPFLSANLSNLPIHLVMSLYICVTDDRWQLQCLISTTLVQSSRNEH